MVSSGVSDVRNEKFIFNQTVRGFTDTSSDNFYHLIIHFYVLHIILDGFVQFYENQSNNP